MFPRRKLLLAVQLAFLLIVGSLYWGRNHIGGGNLDNNSFFSGDSSLHGILSTTNITTYVQAIMDPDNMDLPRLACPALRERRYATLMTNFDANANADANIDNDNGPTIQYFFALNLRGKLPLLPRLLGSIVEAIRFLGPSRCALSIVKGNSDDGTSDVLEALRPVLQAAFGSSSGRAKGGQFRYHLQTGVDMNPQSGDRVGKLAGLRNLALQPLLAEGWTATTVAGSSSSSSSGSNGIKNNEGQKVVVSPSTTVIFLNDVAACTEDILELVYQRRRLGADMVCGFDWVYVGANPTFYDVWIARTLEGGDAFFDIPPDGSWDKAWHLFWNNPMVASRFLQHQPFQVFSCWNGAAVFQAAPLLGGHTGAGVGVGIESGAGDEAGVSAAASTGNDAASTPAKAVAFRSSRNGECVQGEPQLFCKDLWAAGYGKIAVVPSVHLEYSDERGADIKRLMGYTSQWVSDSEDDMRNEPAIAWHPEPPALVRCMPDYAHQSFRPWNETL